MLQNKSKSSVSEFLAAGRIFQKSGIPHCVFLRFNVIYYCFSIYK